MKLLFDENLAPALVGLLQDIFPDSKHVHQCGLGAADDNEIWDFAQANGFTIVSKDSDYQEKSLLQGFPPKVIWLRLGNCSTRQIEETIRRNSVLIHTFQASATDAFLVLS
jgi:predicted nuclease of predicted toxin-antitoxin system